MRKPSTTSLFLAVIALSCALGLGYASRTHAQPLLPSDQAKKDAAAPIPIFTEVPIPTQGLEVKANEYSNGVVRDLADYINVGYQFMIAIVGMLAATMMIIGGFQYLTSAGDAGKIGAAKKRITDAIIGMVLALGSYVLLNTINPALLSFNPLYNVVQSVGTQLSFLPWCEDLRDPNNPSQQVAVETVDSTKTVGKDGNVQSTLHYDCGTIGRYKIGNGTSYCVFRGQCGEKPVQILQQGAPVWTACLQRPGLTNKDIQNLIDSKTSQGSVTGSGTGTHVALCLPCFDISKSLSKSMGYSDLGTACNAWWQTRETQFLDTYASGKTLYNGDIPKEQLNRFWSYCHDTEAKPSCIQADIDCYAANRNSDDQTEGTGIGELGQISYSALATASDVVTFGHGLTQYDCGESKNAACGCEGYDDSPEPLWLKEDYSLDQIENGGAFTAAHRTNLDYYGDHLAEVCMWNPCVDYADAKDPHVQWFKNGCKSGNGTLWSIARFIRKADTSFVDCRNR